MPARLARRHAMLFSGCLFWRSSASVVVLDHGAGFVRHVTDVHELSFMRCAVAGPDLKQWWRVLAVS